MREYSATRLKESIRYLRDNAERWKISINERSFEAAVNNIKNDPKHFRPPLQLSKDGTVKATHQPR